MEQQTLLRERAEKARKTSDGLPARRESTMRKSRFTDEQMVKILREAEKTSVGEVAKKHGVSEQTVYGWRKRFGDMEVDDAKQLKTLEHENARLKKLLAESLVVRRIRIGHLHGVNVGHS